jgi:DNA modification methylase
MSKLGAFYTDQGDCREVLASYSPDTFASLVTDPPYGIGFMNQKWDTFKPGKESARVIAARASANPNVKGRSRSPASSPSAVEYDRTLAGQRAFQEWTASWASAVLRVLKPGAYGVVCGAPRSYHRMVCGLEDAGFEVRDGLQWLFGQGFPKSLNMKGGMGTALKPCWEPIALIRKPLGKLTVREAMREFGTGVLDIDGCRIPSGEDNRKKCASVVGLDSNRHGVVYGGYQKPREDSYHEGGRWPPSIAFDDAAAFALGDKARYFYCPKVSTAEREYGCEALPARTAGAMTGGRAEGSKGLANPRAGAGRLGGARNAHPTVKPLALMRWLVRLVNPAVPGHDRTILDPFIGSGSTAIAAVLEGHECIGIDRESEWLRVAEARVAAWVARTRQGDDVWK